MRICNVHSRGRAMVVYEYVVVRDKEAQLKCRLGSGAFSRSRVVLRARVATLRHQLQHTVDKAQGPRIPYMAEEKYIVIKVGRS